MVILAVTLFACTTYINPVSASWAFAFVVYDGSIYVTTDEHIDPEQIGSRIGAVTKYSDQEGTYAGNFSNRYPKGTKYFAIAGINVKEAIAVKDDEGFYIKATYKGEYAGAREDMGVKRHWLNFSPYVAAALLVILIAYLLVRRIKRP